MGFFMRSIIDELKTGKVLASDGAWGTMLHRFGLQPGECPELWCETHPDVVKQIAESYVEAGADIIETNSFGGNSIRLKEFGLENRASELNEKAAQISRKAAGDDVFVFGSVGPTGKMLLMGEITEEEMYKSFREQVIALERGGADAICVETMLDLTEARLAVRAARENTRLPVACTMTFQKSATGEFYTVMGVSPEQMIDGMHREGASIIGSNCGNGIQIMVEIAAVLRSLDPQIPLMIQSNAGLPENRDGKTIYPETVDFMSSHIPALIEAGVNIIGGCCGTTPEYIKNFVQIIRKHNSEKL